ncbi:MAG: hypothetical protein DRH50_17250 [Deltaproteobacteria bacterium]|nr:MAG: hypothetical protein DRH50_17250 [Deltaproteobacteria bacterium]
MGKPAKILKKWRKNRPKEAKFQEIKTVLNVYFPGMWEEKAGSHIVVRHESLIGISIFGPKGEFTIVKKKGQKVKGHYLKVILKAIDIIEERENL